MAEVEVTEIVAAVIAQAGGEVFVSDEELLNVSLGRLFVDYDAERRGYAVRLELP